MLHRFALADLSPTPWKNGGGSTREIVCRPPGAGMDSFEWRVSIATIAQSGPFSVFAGVDRVILGPGEASHLTAPLCALSAPLTPEQQGRVEAIHRAQLGTEPRHAR